MYCKCCIYDLVKGAIAPWQRITMLGLQHICKIKINVFTESSLCVPKYFALSVFTLLCCSSLVIYIDQLSI